MAALPAPRRAPAQGVGSAEYWEDRCLQLADENKNLKDINLKLETKCKQLGVRLTKIHEDLKKKEMLDREGGAPVSARKRDLEVEDLLDEQRKIIREQKTKITDLTKKINYYKQITEVKRAPSAGNGSKKMFGAAESLSRAASAGKAKSPGGSVVGSPLGSPHSQRGDPAERKAAMQALRNMLQQEHDNNKRLENEVHDLRMRLRANAGGAVDYPTRDTETSVYDLQAQVEAKELEIKNLISQNEDIKAKYVAQNTELGEAKKKLRTAGGDSAGGTTEDHRLQALTRDKQLLQDELELLQKRVAQLDTANKNLMDGLLNGEKAEKRKDAQLKHVNIEADYNGLKRVYDQREMDLKVTSQERDEYQKRATRLQTELELMSARVARVEAVFKEIAGKDQAAQLQVFLESSWDQVRGNQDAKKLKLQVDQLQCDYKLLAEQGKKDVEILERERDNYKKMLEGKSTSATPMVTQLQEDIRIRDQKLADLERRYQELKEKHNNMVYAPVKGAPQNSLVSDLAPGEVTISIEVNKLELSEKVRKDVLADDSAVFVAFDFFEHDTRFTPVLSCRGDLTFDFTAQYTVHVDDFFCHYLSKENLVFDAYHTVGTEPHKFGTLSLPNQWGNVFSDGEQCHTKTMMLDNGQEAGRLGFTVKVTPSGLLKSSMERFRSRSAALHKGADAKPSKSATLEVSVGGIKLNTVDKWPTASRRVFCTFKVFNFDDVVLDPKTMRNDAVTKPDWQPALFTLGGVQVIEAYKKYADTEQVRLLLLDEDDENFDLVSGPIKLPSETSGEQKTYKLTDLSQRDAGSIDVRIVYKG